MSPSLELAQEKTPAVWSCENCVFFIAMKEQKRDDSKIGNCHVNAPTISDDSKIGRFPIVISNMWCGQYQER